MTRREVIKGSLRFFDECEFFKSRAASGRHRERPSDLVKRCGNRDHLLISSGASGCA